YSSSQAFLEDFYFDFDVRVKKLPVATLIKPVTNMDENNPTVQIAWSPLKADVKWNVYVSVDDAKTWTKIANQITETSCVWNAGNIMTRFYLKIEAPDNMNLSSKYGPFVKGDLTKLNFISPIIDNYAIAGDTLSVKWGTTSIQRIKLEYATNVVPALPVNAADWKTISGDISTTVSNYRWAIPATLEGTCRLKITDISNANNYSESEIFNLVKPNETGGPYLYDKNTLLLLHFDNDLSNRSLAIGNAVGDIQNISGSNVISSQFGKSYKTVSSLTVPHHVNLNLTGDWTLEAWVKLNSFGSNDMYLFCKPGDIDTYFSNYALEINPWWGNIFFGYYFSQAKDRIGLSTNFSPSLNEWYHVAYIRNTAKNQLQLIVHDKNRNLISSVDFTYSPNETLLNSKDLIIGANLDGYIDEVRISNTVRSFINTGVNKTYENQEQNFYPNPAKEWIAIKNTTGVYKMEIDDLQGKTLIIRKMEDMNERINISSLPKGIYLLKFYGDKEISIGKLIVK
ncbi:MAG TPA: T9SS type A sorting domain-containing protein, partial [Paludibacteraceae bacterium]|nr:T9SS type A sorting domain-containing protein [Paludibacteraceae bacterium]